MSGVEFRLGHGDHHVVSDFLADGPEGVAGIVVDAKYLERQSEAIAAAHEAGIEVHAEPLTDRLVAEGYSLGELEYGDGVIDPASDLVGQSAIDRLVQAVAEPQLAAGVTAVTPAHFYCETDEELELNLRLLRRTRKLLDEPMRPILAAKRVLLDDDRLAARTARAYREEGVRTIDLRLSPLGGRDDGRIKIRSALKIVQVFRDTGLRVMLGSQGTIGQAALALGLATRFSVGIGYREHYNHKEAIRRQIATKRKKDSGEKTRGPTAGIYIPPGMLTVVRSTGNELYESNLRLRLRCGIGACAEHVDGPSRDPRGHYLHARAADTAQILAQPEPWRPNLQRDRLVVALDLRRTLNQHLADTEFQTRTLDSLLGEIDAQLEAAA